MSHHASPWPGRVNRCLAKPADSVSADDLKEWAEQASEFVKEKDESKDNVPHQMHKFRDEFEAHVRAGGCTLPAEWRAKHPAFAGAHH